MEYSLYVATVIRYLMPFFGGQLAISDSTIQQVAGALVTLAAFAWSIFRSKKGLK